MKQLQNLKVAQKLTAGFGICILIAIIAVFSAIIQMGKINTTSKTIVSDVVAQTQSMATLLSDIKQYRIWQLRYVIAKDNTVRDQMDSDLQSAKETVEQDLSDYKSNAKREKDAENINKLKAHWDEYYSFDSKIRATARANKPLVSDHIISVVANSAWISTRDLGASMLKDNKDNASQLSQEADNQYRSALLITIISLIVAIVAGVFMASSITKSMVVSLQEADKSIDMIDKECITKLEDAIISISKGDLTHELSISMQPINVSGDDEIGELCRSLNDIIERLGKTVEAYNLAQKSLSSLIGQVSTASNTISLSSSELSTGNEDLASRTTEQASSLEETASSMEEMTSIVRQNAESAHRASSLASDAKLKAKNGVEVVTGAVNSMQEISKSSKQISDIISVIDEIAFQTNLLALNAAVEAARVGEQGKGFAVVASEVRNLAGRSSTAAKEIKALVQDTVRKVVEGEELVGRSGDQFNEIVSSIENVAGIVSEISAAAQEQSTGIEQVNKAVMQMDEITQQNAALVEEASAASVAVSRQAADLSNLVNHFKVEANAMEFSPAPAKPVSPNQTKARSTGTYGQQKSKAQSSSPVREKLKLVDTDSSATFEEF